MNKRKDDKEIRQFVEIWDWEENSEATCPRTIWISYFRRRRRRLRQFADEIPNLSKSESVSRPSLDSSASSSLSPSGLWSEWRWLWCLSSISLSTRLPILIFTFFLFSFILIDRLSFFFILLISLLFVKNINSTLFKRHQLYFNYMLPLNCRIHWQWKLYDMVDCRYISIN